MLGRASRRAGHGGSAFRPQGVRRCHFRGRRGGQGVQRGQKFFPVQAVQTAWRVQTRLLFRVDIQQARPGVGQSRLPGGMAGVPAGEAESGGRKTARQKEAGGRTGRVGTTAARTPGNGHSPSCFTRVFCTEHCPALPERTGTGGESGVAGQAGAIRKTGAAPAFQALARQTQSVSWQPLALP